MLIKLVIGGCTLNVISAYAPWAWARRPKALYEDLDEAVRGIPITEKIVIGGDFNGHIGQLQMALMMFMEALVLGRGMGRFFARSLLRLSNYLLLRKGDRGLVKDCKVIPSEDCTTQHKLLVMDLVIKRDRRKKIVADRRD
ncbi:hypothetical protein H5410_023654 [Solanum commersonii]|uniref:Craniofacial development protein 2-like n=1 Tax=Solanum commersonii TaxID=4109 RepID=A0A9J5ZIM4_SOLCO|nr:hypothetical protein H5410_023654 [Solanum commersonii]